MLSACSETPSPASPCACTSPAAKLQAPMRTPTALACVLLLAKDLPAAKLPDVLLIAVDDLNNWCGPTIGAVEALIQSAGFARARTLKTFGASVCVSAERRWPDLPPETKPLELLGIHSHNKPGRSFRSEKEEHLSLGCRYNGESATPAEVKLDQVFRRNRWLRCLGAHLQIRLGCREGERRAASGARAG